MKSDEIQETIQPVSREGTSAENLNMGRIQRIRGVSHLKGSRRRKLKSESRQVRQQRKEQHRIIIIWSVLLCGITISVLGYFLVQWMMPRIKPAEVSSIKTDGIAPKSEIKTKKVFQFPSPTSDEALAMVKHALTLREPAQVAEYFRLNRASPQEIVDFLQGMNARDGEIDSVTWLSSLDTSALPLEGVLVKFKGLGRPSSRMALMTPDDAGKWRIDFDAFARTVIPSWTDLLEKQAPVGVVRIFVHKDSYYNGPFLDEKEWLCYSIGSIDSKETLRAYCKIGSPQAAAMSWMLSKGAKINRATLEIRRVNGAESRQFEISRVLAEDWVLDQIPLDEKFK